MPDSTTDLDALAAQLKVLSGDLNRRFEILSGDLGRSREEMSSSVKQLNDRMDELITSRKVALSFKPGLGGEWLNGTTSPLVTIPGAVPVFVTAGGMAVALPNLSRIAAFRASLRISDAPMGGVGILDVSLQRTVIDTDQAEVVVPLPCPFVPGVADPRGDAIPGKEFVDNDRFKYSVSALFVVQQLAFNPVTPGPTIVVQPGQVVFEGFEVDCIVA